MYVLSWWTVSHSFSLILELIFSRCFATWEINTKITFSWDHEYSSLQVIHSSLYTTCVLLDSYSVCIWWNIMFISTWSLRTFYWKCTLYLKSPLHLGHLLYRDNFVYAPSQWEMTLDCNVFSHWLGAYKKLSLYCIVRLISPQIFVNCIKKAADQLVFY